MAEEESLEQVLIETSRKRSTNGPGPDIEISDLRDADYADTYEVEVMAKPAMFFFKQNYILTVFDNGPAAEAGVEAYSRVLKVNDIDIDPDSEHFSQVFKEVTAPFNMTLQKRKLNPADAMAMGESKPFTTADKLRLMMVYMSVAIDVFGAMMVIPVLPFLAKELNFQDSQLGLVLAAYSFAAIPGSLITLRLAMWKGTKFGILYSIIGSSATLILQGFAWNFPSLLAFRICAGLTGSSMPVAMTHIGIVVPNNLKPIWMSYVGVCITCALVVGPAFGGSLVHYGIKMPYFAGGGIAALGFVFAAVFLPNLEVPKTTSTDKGTLTKPNYAVMLLSLLKPLPFAAHSGMVGNYLLKMFGMDGQSVGLIMSIQGIWSTFSTIVFYPRVSKCLSLPAMYVLGAFGMMIGFLCGAFMPDKYSFSIIMVVVSGGGFGFLNNSISPLADSWAKPTTRARIHSYASILDNLGFTIASSLWGVVFQIGMDMDQENLIWLCAAGAAFFCMVTSFLVKTCILEPRSAAIAAKKKHDDLERTRAQEHKLKGRWGQHGSVEERMELGNAVADLLQRKGYEWVKYGKFVTNSLERMIPALPTDTIEHRFRKIEQFNQVVDLAEESYKEEEDEFENMFGALYNTHTAHKK